MDYSDAQIIEVMFRLGVSQADLQRAQTSQRALDALKARLKRSYKALALEWTERTTIPRRPRCFNWRPMW